MKIKVAKWGTPKKYLKKMLQQLCTAVKSYVGSFNIVINHLFLVHLYGSVEAT
jgi:hypothetical protein